MRVKIKPDESIKLTLAPSNTTEEIIQNIYCILKTPIRTVPFYREFGVRNDYLHRPIPASQSAFTAAIVNAISEFEPRAQVTRVTFDIDVNNPGYLIPTVEVTFLE